MVDAAGRQVGGATLRIRAPDGLVTRAGSTEYHTFLTGGPAGEWTITVTPPSGRALAPDQPNPVRVAVPARQTVVVRIALVPTGGG